MTVTPWIWLFIISAIILTLQGWFLGRNKFQAGVREMELICYASAAWALVDIVDLITTGPNGKDVLASLKIPFLVWVEFLMLLLVLRMRNKAPLSPRITKVLLIYPLLTTVLFLTNGLTHLVYLPGPTVNNGVLDVYQFQPTTLYWVVSGMSYVYLGTAMWIMLRAYIRRWGDKVYRYQQTLVILGVTLPIVVTTIYALLLDPYAYFLPTPLMMPITVGLIFLSIFLMGLFNITPIARSTLLDNMNEPMMVMDNSRAIIETNRGMRALLSIDDRDAKRIVPLDDLQKSWPELYGAVTGRPEKGAIELRKDGAVQYYDHSITTLHHPDMGEIGQLVLLHDVTDNKNAERVLKQSEHRFRSLLETAPFPIVITDMDEGRIMYANSMVVRQLGERDAPYVGMLTSPTFFSEDTRDRMVEMIMQRGTVEQAEIPLQRVDGRMLTAYGNACLIDYQGAPAIFSAFNDITPLIEAKDALALANKKLNLLSSITRHDLLNKLTIVAGYIDLMKSASDPLSIKNYIDRVDRSAREAQSLILFTKQYQDIGVKEPEWYNVGESFLTAWRQIENQQVKVDLEVDGLRVFADALFTKVLYNLIDNSLRYGEHVTTIGLGYRIEDGRLVLVYRDDGVGIPLEEKGRIFEPGYGRNTGLGLALSRDVLSITDMVIRERGVPGQGATFEITVVPGKYRLDGLGPAI